MKHFIHQAVGEVRDLLPSLVVELGQLVEEAFEFGLLRRIETLAQAGDHRGGKPVPRFGKELLAFFVNDSLGGRNLFTPGGPIAVARRGEVVNRVQVHAELVPNRGVEIARHGEVEHKQRALLARGRHQLAEGLERDDRLARGGGADDNIRGGEFQVQPFQGGRFTRPLGRQSAGPLRITIDDGDLASAQIHEVPQRFIRHLAGANHQHLLRAEVFKNLPGEIGDRHARDAHPMTMKHPRSAV